ncbi:hypothetical protein BaRGS_00012708 [Batillaria attramentaria]|uniref:Uncharacterized protein n=1 Tax=Batillaria attramentaria TaxID=370345 RepID=A0ABD0L927_9CAEN
MVNAQHIRTHHLLHSYPYLTVTKAWPPLQPHVFRRRRLVSQPLEAVLSNFHLQYSPPVHRGFAVFSGRDLVLTGTSSWRSFSGTLHLLLLQPPRKRSDKFCPTALTRVAREFAIFPGNDLVLTDTLISRSSFALCASSSFRSPRKRSDKFCPTARGPRGRGSCHTSRWVTRINVDKAWEEKHRETPVAIIGRWEQRGDIDHSVGLRYTRKYIPR